MMITARCQPLDVVVVEACSRARSGRPRALVGLGVRLALKANLSPLEARQ